MTFEPQHTPATHDFIPRSHSISSHPTRLLTSTPSSHKLTSSAPMSCPSAMLPPPPTTLTTSLPLPLTKNPRTDLLDPSSRPPPSALSSRLLSSPNEPTSSPDSSYPTACDQQTSSGSSTNSIVAPCSPASNSSPPLLHVPSPHLPRIRKIHIDFSYRKPTPNLTPVEPTPEELLAQDFRFLTHEPRQPLYRPAVLRRNKFYPPTQPPAGSDHTFHTTTPLQGPQSPVSPLDGSPDTSSSLSSIHPRSSRSSFNSGSIVPFRVVPHTPNTVIIDGKKFGRLCPKSRWVPDIKRDSCAHDNCPQRFNFINRKHHCRCCGDIFCRAHASETAQLFDGGPAGETTGSGLPTCRVCDTCAVTLSCGIDPISPKCSMRDLMDGPTPHSPRTRASALSDSVTSATSSASPTQPRSRHRRHRTDPSHRQGRSRSSKSSQPSAPPGRAAADQQLNTPTSSASSNLTRSSAEISGIPRDGTQRSKLNPTTAREADSNVVYNCLNLNSKPYHPFPVIPIIEGSYVDSLAQDPAAQPEPVEQWPDREEETEEEEDDDDDEEDVEETVIRYQPSRLFW